MAKFVGERQLVLTEGMAVKAIRLVSDDEHALYLKHAEVIRKFGKDYELLRLVIKAFEDFTKFMRQSVEVIRANALLNQAALIDYSFESASLIINYLNVARIFVDHFEIKLSREFGENSDQFAKYKALLKTEFHEYFSYRFLYRLRNYTTHCGLPLLHYELKRIPGEHASLTITMKPKELLASFKKWGPDVSRDLNEMAGDIYVRPVLTENVNSNYFIYHSLYAEHYRTEILESTQWLREFIGDDTLKRGYAIAQDVEGDKGEGLNTLLDFIATDEVRRAAEVEEVFLAHNTPVEIEI